MEKVREEIGKKRDRQTERDFVIRELETGD